MKVIGRQEEIKQLEKIFQSQNAEFVAVYGRRRIGKTYLIKQFFKDKKCLFLKSSGLLNGKLKIQLENFQKEIEATFYENRPGMRLSAFSNWNDAFRALHDAIELFAEKQKIVIFLDEFPWMAKPKSGLLEALDYFWNRFWSEDKRIKLIICGSAASWIIENILHNTGGLHNRVTLKLHLSPFSLKETQDYLQSKKIKYNLDQILKLYMCIGGVPYYLTDVTHSVIFATENRRSELL